MKIFIELSPEICLKRRIKRDVGERGRTFVSVEQQFIDTVQPMYERYVAQTCCHAGLVLRGDAAIADITRKVINAITDREQI